MMFFTLVTNRRCIATNRTRKTTTTSLCTVAGRIERVNECSKTPNKWELIFCNIFKFKILWNNKNVTLF